MYQKCFLSEFAFRNSSDRISIYLTQSHLSNMSPCQSSTWITTTWRLNFTIKPEVKHSFFKWILGRDGKTPLMNILYFLLKQRHKKDNNDTCNGSYLFQIYTTCTKRVKDTMPTAKGLVVPEKVLRRCRNLLHRQGWRNEEPT